MKCLPALVLLILPLACQTGAPEMPTPLPMRYRQLFAACAPRDGAAVLQFFRSKNLQASADLEWKSDSPAAWQLQLTDPLGSTMLSLARRSNELRARGRLAPKLPALGVEKAEFLAVKGHRIGLKAHELPCVLGGRLPSGWLALAAGVSLPAAQSKDPAIISFRDDDRAVELTIHEASNRQAQSFCASIKWAKLLWMYTSELRWCQKGQDLRETTLSGYEDYVVRLVRIDEGLAQ